MAFYVGQKVVCVENPPCECGHCNGHNPFVKGNIYTIVSITEDEIGTWLYLAETPPPNEHDGVASWAFRPIVSRPTSISIFTAMLGPTKVKEDA